ncbi:hypothetical protein Plhal710r2_c002g0001841 [Plasmopara halstedii]
MFLQSMQSALFSKIDKNHFAANSRDDSHDSDSLLGPHTTFLDDDCLNHVPLTDFFTSATNSTETMTDQSQAIGLTDALGDFDAPLLDAAFDFSLDTDLPPILEPYGDGTLAVSPLSLSQQPNSSYQMCVPTKSHTDTTQQIISSIGKNGIDENVAPSAGLKRPRTRGSSWLEQEKNIFFAMFKVKWLPAFEGKSMPSLCTLLLQRFDAISTKIRTKSVMEVRNFYTSVMQNVMKLLKNVEHDIDLSNPDQVRIAVWCWGKLMTDKTNVKEFESHGSESSTEKTNLANLLLQSIIRSRRQMLKAKSESKYTPATGSTSISAWVARSNLSLSFARSSIFNQELQVHHPMVRKKSKQKLDSLAVTENGKEVLSVVQQFGRDLPEKKVTLKRKRTAVGECFSFAKKTCCVSSPLFKKDLSQSRKEKGVAFRTTQLPRKKFYIKMRMIPRDKQTKADVMFCGGRPKVELKLSSTKKISQITAHMSNKWAKVQSLVPKGSVLCFYKKNGLEKWSMDDSNVTCFDVWKLCGKQSNGENVVEVSYMWQLPSTKCEDDKNQRLMPLQAPPGLFDKLPPPANTDFNSVIERRIAKLSTACGLEEQSEQVVFDPSIPEQNEKEEAALEAMISDCADKDNRKNYSPITGCLRRRIKPELVLKEEFNI